MEDRIITNINVSGMIVGYDPGGNGAHGLALASPKVMYFELAKKKYNYKECNKEMDSFLSDLIGINISTKNDHEWDAAASIYAVYCGATGKWVNNLHSKSVTNNVVLVEPCGPTSYWWPK